MKYILFYLLISFIQFSQSTNDKQSLLTNSEIKEVLKCFGELNLDEGCVICRYITQKICK
jgi:hypothetical protein